MAAAEPSGNAGLVWQAARKLNIAAEAAAPAVEAGLVEFGARVRFRHPLARSAVYRSATVQGRREAYAALAEVTDPVGDPDRRAWHRAQAASGPDETFWAAIWAGDRERLRDAAAAGRAMPSDPAPHRAVDVLLDALALRFTEGYATAAPALTRALKVLMHSSDITEVERLNGRPDALVALELWDFESWQAIAASQVRMARKTGALVFLQFALTHMASTRLLAGEVAVAARLVDEDQLIAEATRNPPFKYAAMMLAAWCGDETKAAELIKATVRDATEGNRRDNALGAGAGFRGLLERRPAHNGLRKYEAAYAAVSRATGP